MDAYDLQARLAPAVFSISPMIIVAIAVVPGLGELKISGATVAGAVVVALLFMSLRVARSLGRARQNALFQTWGGPPTTAMLHYSDTRLNPRTKEIYRERLRCLGPSFAIPDAEQERANPKQADIEIGAAVDEVRRRAKEQGIKAVHRENINYGAARNAYGPRPLGLGICAVAAAVLGVNIALRGGFSPASLDIVIWAAIGIIAAGWIFGFTSESVRHHAEAYALALFEAIETVTAGRTS
jgi:hypothetical protein